jgi:8-oxo-dGTP pyrophosphatase MutT (NUDIX family)
MDNIDPYKNIDNNDPYKNIDKKSFCINCGKIGHNSKKCLCPIISIGIVCIRFNLDNIELNSIISYTKKIQNNYLFSSDELIKLKKLKNKLDTIDMNNYDNLIEYLLIRRRNSLNYVEFIRGKYDINNVDYIQKSLNYITEYEKNMIKNNDFNMLWEDLWGENNNNSEYFESFEKFNLLKNGIIIKKNELNIKYSFHKILNDTYFNFKEPEWGFPKGRRNSREKNIDCAKREFQEETSIKDEEYNIINISPLEETYLASNNLKYKHIYYIGQIKNRDINIEIDNNNINQKIEISDIKWLKFKDSLNIIRDYNIEKKNILLNLHYTIKYTLENFINILNIFLKKNT